MPVVRINKKSSREIAFGFVLSFIATANKT